MTMLFGYQLCIVKLHVNDYAIRVSTVYC